MSPTSPHLHSTNSAVQQPRRPRRPRVTHRARNTHAIPALPLPLAPNPLATLPGLAKVFLRIPRLRPLRQPAKRAQHGHPPAQTRAQNPQQRTTPQIARPAPPHAPDIRHVQNPHQPSLKTHLRRPLRLRALLVARRAPRLRTPHTGPLRRHGGAQHHRLVAGPQPRLRASEPRPPAADWRAGAGARVVCAAAARRERAGARRARLRGGQLAAAAERESRGADESDARRRRVAAACGPELG